MTENAIIKIEDELFVIANQIDSIRNKNIFFGHQSVGSDILDGLRHIAKEDTRFTIEITEVSKEHFFDRPLFAHAKIGKNHDPKSKCTDFINWMKNGFGNQVDIAFFKFCFVDITAKSDPQDIFNEYMRTMNYLKNIFPNVKFVHVTAPLLIRPGGPKNFIKRLFNNSPDLDNMRRCEFNHLLRSHYQDKDPIFDLAAVESTYSDGHRNSFSSKGKSYFSLIPEYTHDGGHLNKRGQYLAAKELLLLLAEISTHIN